MTSHRDALAEIKDRADIVQVVGERVALSPSGADFVGLCPFHGEKTPSFRVSPGRRMYHCFGCGAGGSVIDFVMASDNLSFGEAVRALAERFGVPLGNAPGSPTADRAGEALEAARQYYHEQLLHRPEGEPARRYLRERGFEEPTWQAFSLGFALDQWQGFTDHAQVHGFDHDDLLAAGLVRRSQGGRLFDMLRNRVVFPILNEPGRAIAFGGRVISPQDQPKYLNTPETRLYRKSRVLFGLAQGREVLRRDKRAMLVEGYLDVIRLHEQGFTQALATCGTSLTEEHLKLLERFAERVTLVFDGDDAGVKAALRSAPLFLNRGLEARVVLLPDGLDPDDFLSRRGAAAFTEALQQADPILEFLVFQLLKRHGRSPQGKEKALMALVPVLSAVGNEAVRDVTVRYLADLIGVRVENVVGLLAPARTSARNTAQQPPAFSLSERQGRHQRRFLRILLQERALIVQARALLKPEDLTDPALGKVYEKLLRFSDEELEGMELEELMELAPAEAATMRALLVEDTRLLQDLSDSALQLQEEILHIKEDLKQALFLKLKQVADTPEEELAFRRYQKLRTELLEGRAAFRRTHKPRPELTLRGAPKPEGS